MCIVLSLYVYPVLVCMYMCILLFAFSGLSFVAFSFSTLILLVGSFDHKNRLPYNLYCVGGDVKHYSIQVSFVLFSLLYYSVCFVYLTVLVVYWKSRVWDH